MMKSSMPKWFIILIFGATPLVFVSCKEKPQKNNEANEPDEVSRSINEVTDMYARQIEGEGDLQSDNDTLTRAIEAARQAEMSSTGQKAANHMVLRHWLTLMRDQNLAQVEHQALIQEGSFYEKVTTAEEIDALSQKIHKYLEYNQEVQQKTKTGWMLQLKELAEADGQDSKHVAKSLGEISSSFNLIKAQLLIIRQKDDEMCHAILNQHKVLKQAIGSWKWDKEKAIPVFDSPETQEEFNLTDQAIRKAIKEQNEAQAKVLAIQQGG